MTGRQRIVLLTLAAVVLIAGIALATSSDDEDEEPGREATTTEAPARTAPAGDTTEAQAEEPPPAPRVETIRMKGRAPAGEPKTFTYERGETIRLRFVSDVAEEVHIHGFDEYVDVPAGGRPKTVRFEADLEGIFEVESHGSGELLAELEVRPR